MLSLKEPCRLKKKRTPRKGAFVRAQLEPHLEHSASNTGSDMIKTDPTQAEAIDSHMNCYLTTSNISQESKPFSNHVWWEAEGGSEMQNTVLECHVPSTGRKEAFYPGALCTLREMKLFILEEK